MRNYWYQKRFKNLNKCLQGVLAGILALCIFLVLFMMEGHLSSREISLSFENTSGFLKTVESIVRDKISYDQNRMLFEQNGDFDETKTIDVRQYISGSMDESSENRNTTYHIRDLIDYAKNDAAALSDRLEELVASGNTEAQIGAILAQEQENWETILPVSGASLVETSRLSNNTDSMLFQYCRDLCETSLDIARRYNKYMDEESLSARNDAPCNVAYYVENTSTKQIYTNLEVTNLTSALNTVKQRELRILFSGERKLNIMVADPACYFSDTVTQYFMQTSFVGVGERILLAVDPAYAVGDALHGIYVRYLRREPVLIGAVVAGVCSVLLLIILLVISVFAAGRSSKDAVPALTSYDQIPMEIAASVSAILVITWGLLCVGLTKRLGLMTTKWFAMVLPMVFVAYEICLEAFLGLVRRIKCEAVWKNSVCYYVVLGTRQVYSARRSSQRLLLLYGSYIILNILFLRTGNISGFLMALILNMAALLYLMRDVVGNQNVRAGLKEISRGELGYRINTEVLTGESREMGEAVNEMGEGLQKAVDTMLQGERLKAELITNVSHDLKTPLTSIINYIDLLKRRNIEDEKAAEYLEILENKSHRLRQMTEDLIEVSKITSGNVELHPQRLGLQQFVWQAEGEFEDTLGARGLRICVDQPEEPIEIYVDGAKLWRVFENLLGNAAKYAKEDSLVLLKVQRMGDDAVIRFENEPQDQIRVSASHLQERFIRGDESRSTEGFGLGLSIAGNLTRLMGGSFDLQLDENLFAAIVTFPVRTAEGEKKAGEDQADGEDINRTETES